MKIHFIKIAHLKKYISDQKKKMATETKRDTKDLRFHITARFNLFEFRMEEKKLESIKTHYKNMFIRLSTSYLNMLVIESAKKMVE